MNKHTLLIYKLKGKSMFPYLKAEDLVLVKKNEEELIQGKIYGQNDVVHRYINGSFKGDHAYSIESLVPPFDLILARVAKKHNKLIYYPLCSLSEINNLLAYLSRKHHEYHPSIISKFFYALIMMIGLLLRSFENWQLFKLTVNDEAIKNVSERNKE